MFYTNARYTPKGDPELDGDYYPIRSVRRIAVKTHRFSGKITIYRVRGYDDSLMKDSAATYSSLYEFMQDWSEFSEMEG